HKCKCGTIAGWWGRAGIGGVGSTTIDVDGWSLIPTSSANCGRWCHVTRQSWRGEDDNEVRAGCVVAHHHGPLGPFIRGQLVHQL
ncbi:hypothetical protein Hamer_G006260, partial [Homarus americanus]